jgi:23S rRNA pseudoU1915 N3-methylase RlmH
MHAEALDTLTSSERKELRKRPAQLEQQQQQEEEEKEEEEELGQQQEQQQQHQHQQKQGQRLAALQVQGRSHSASRAAMAASLEHVIDASELTLREVIGTGSAGKVRGIPEVDCQVLKYSAEPQS